MSSSTRSPDWDSLVLCSLVHYKIVFYPYWVSLCFSVLCFCVYWCWFAYLVGPCFSVFGCWICFLNLSLFLCLLWRWFVHWVTSCTVSILIWDLLWCWFVFSCSSAAPVNGFMILNRLGLNDLIEPLTKNLEFQLQDPFLLYKNTAGE